MSTGQRIEAHERPATKEALRRARLALLVLCGITVVLGSIYTVLRGEHLAYHDETQYLEMARNLAAGQGYSLDGVQPTAYRPPAYSVLLVLPVKLGLGIAGCRLVNYVLFLGCLALVYALARRHDGPMAAVLAPLFCLGYPVLFYTAGTLYPQTLGAFLLLVAVWLFSRRPCLTVRRSLLLGSVLGLAVLTMPTLGLTVPFLVLGPMLGRQRQAVRSAAVIVGGVLLAVLPWTIRNAIVFDEFIPVSTNGGLNLLLGNTESTTPNAGVNVDISSVWGEVEGLDEVARDRHLRARALEWIAAHPADAARLYLLKFLNYFNFRNDLATRSEVSKGRDLIVLVTYAGLCLLVIARLATAARQPLRRLERLILILYLGYGLGLALFFTRIRFRVPLDYLLACLAAVSAARLIDRFAGRTHATDAGAGGEPVTRPPGG